MIASTGPPPKNALAESAIPEYTVIASTLAVSPAMPAVIVAYAILPPIYSVQTARTLRMICILQVSLSGMSFSLLISISIILPASPVTLALTR